MGVNLQQYRSRIGTYHQSRIKSNSKNKIGGKTLARRKKSSSYPGFKLSLLLLICLASACSFNKDLNKNESQQKLQNSVNCSDTGGAWGNKIELPGDLASHRSWLEDANFAARYTHGNRRTGIKLAHWNKGGGYLGNKINEIENLI